MTRAHVIGAGLAGLSAAMTLAERGYRVTLSDGAPRAGGRCRSYRDPKLGLTIDNGNHLVLSGNDRTQAYLARIGASHALAGPEEARFPFVDLRDGARWTLHPNDGPLPWWVLAKRRRVPGTRAADYLPLARLLRPRPDQRIADLLPPRGALWDRLLEPFFVAALNTEAAGSSARLAGAIVSGTLARGGRACRPLIATPTLAAAFVDPALAWLAAQDATVRLGRRLRALGEDGRRVTRLAFADGEEPVGADEPVVIATPPPVAAELLPGLSVPTAFEGIVNAHFAGPPPPGTAPIVGVIGGTAQWIFALPDRLSVTISAANHLMDADRDDLAARIWADVAAVHRLSGPMPPWQIVRERRATFAATPEQDRLRPGAVTHLRNLTLAGDWTQTGLPSTIEGAIRSGETAAQEAIRIAHVPS